MLNKKIIILTITLFVFDLSFGQTLNCKFYSLMLDYIAKKADLNFGANSLDNYCIYIDRNTVTIDGKHLKNYLPNNFNDTILLSENYISKRDSIISCDFHDSISYGFLENYHSDFFLLLSDFDVGIDSATPMDFPILLNFSNVLLSSNHHAISSVIYREYPDHTRVIYTFFFELIKNDWSINKVYISVH